MPAAAATEGREAHTTYRTRLSNYARRETSNACGEECDEPLQLKPRTTLSTMVVISSLQLLLLPLQRARPGGEAACRPISCGILMQDGLLGVDQLQPALSSRPPA